MFLGSSFQNFGFENFHLLFIVDAVYDVVNRESCEGFIEVLDVFVVVAVTFYQSQLNLLNCLI
jgi:hypothetical protein